MKPETYANKLAQLLGLEEKKQEVDKLKATRKGNLQGITEDEIDSFREAQGIIYFLEAPALFQYKVCKHCNADFLVSRLYVAYCSYTCIRNSMREEWGIEWKKGKTIEEIVQDPQVFDGQEPLWVRNIPQLKLALQKLEAHSLTLPSP